MVPGRASTQAGNIHTLYDVLLIATVPIFVLVETVVLFSVWKFRMRPGEEEKDGPPIHGNTRLEVVWTAVPAVLILGLCSYAYTVLRSNEDSKKGEMTVNVTERQFAFEFSYPMPAGKQVVSPVLYLPKGRPVVFKLRSLDVIHSFFVPEFSEKLDAVPGITTTLRVTPTRLGTYPAECTELCGAGHSLMRAQRARGVTPAAFQAGWLAADQRAAADRDAAAERDPGRPGLRRRSGRRVVVVELAARRPRPRRSVVERRAPAPPPARRCSPARRAAADATRSRPPARPGRSARTSMSGCGATARPRPRRRSAARRLSSASRPRSRSPYAYIPTGYSAGIMPSNFAQRLTQTQIQALVNFLASVAK